MKQSFVGEKSWGCLADNEKTESQLRNAIAGRSILFIGIGFYDYEEQIAGRLAQLGAHVTVFQDQPLVLREGPLAALVRRFRLSASALQLRHERRILLSAETTRFDQVVVIKAVGLSKELLAGLRERQPQAEFVLYQWDSMRRLAGITERLPFFDRFLSFDRLDVQADDRMTFRPLFFREGLSTVSKVKDIDVCFVGLLHSDRLEFVRRMEAEAKSLGLRTYVYLFTGAWTWMRLKLRGAGRGVHVRAMSYTRLMELNLRSRCVLDLPHPAQAGLTMRAIETLGMQCKLATTSHDIVNYDFYSPKNVRLINNNEPILESSFVCDTLEAINPDIIRFYSLDFWLADVILGQSSPFVNTSCAKQVEVK